MKLRVVPPLFGVALMFVIGTPIGLALGGCGSDADIAPTDTVFSSSERDCRLSAEVQVTYTDAAELEELLDVICGDDPNPVPVNP